MTRTASRTSVFVLSLAFAWALPAFAGPPAKTPPAEEKKPEAPPAPAPNLNPAQRFLLKGFTDTPGLVETVGQAQAESQRQAFHVYNEARDTAETTARKTATSDREVIDAIRKDPAVVAALGVARAAVSKENVPAAAREQVASALIAVDQPEQAAQLSMQTLAREPDNRDALNNLSQARYSLGHYREAIENATRLAQKAAA